jgi:hypothetical protein
MASKTHAAVAGEELVVKNGSHEHDDYDSPKKGYPSKEYPSGNYPGKEYPSGTYPSGNYPDKEYPVENYPYEDFPEKKYPGYPTVPGYPGSPEYPGVPSGGYPPVGYPGYPGKSLKAKGSFETPIPLRGMFDGEIWASVHEDGGVAPTNIIRIDQDWGVLVKWRTSGCLTRMICGTWCLNVCLESIGPGPELRLPEKAVKVELDPCSAKGNPLTATYKCYVEIPRGYVKPEHCSIPYKVVTTLTYLEPCGTPGPIAAYVEGQILQFYEP